MELIYLAIAAVVVAALIIYKVWTTYSSSQSGGGEVAVQKPKVVIKKTVQPPPESKHPIVFFDVAVGGQPAGRIVMELFNGIAPRTCENFRQLCTGQAPSAGQFPMSYKNTPFHRIISGFMIQGGDITAGDGTGGFSIYGERFPDETFAIPHNTPGLLSMANAGPNTNGSQFFITTAPAPHLDGKHVVFGRVVEGLEVVKGIESLSVDQNSRPIQQCVILNCGQLQ